MVHPNAEFFFEQAVHAERAQHNGLTIMIYAEFIARGQVHLLQRWFGKSNSTGLVDYGFDFIAQVYGVCWLARRTG